MSKENKFYTFKFLHAVLFICLSLSVSSAQNNTALTSDLNSTFRNYDLIRINPADAFDRISRGQHLEIHTDMGKLEIALRPRNLLSPNYLAEVRTANEGNHALSAPALRTFKGTVLGENDSNVRLTITESKIEGFVVRGGERFFLESAKRFSASAGAEDFVLYKSENLRQEIQIKCDLEDKINSAAEKFLPAQMNSVAPAPIVRVAEIATEADFEFVTVLGGALEANGEILSIINMIEGTFEREVGVTFNVTFQHAWTTPDPYPAADPQTVLFAFQNYWNTNYPNNRYRRDLAHLFSNKPSLRGQGRAFNNVVCRPEVAYGLNGRFDVGLIKFTLASHEIGHNFGANHVDAAQGCENTIMNVTLSNLTPLTFCPFSRNEIINYVSVNGDCLTPRALTATKYDFDGDDKADSSVFRPSNGSWYIFNSGLGNFRFVNFGLAGDIPVAEDYDGDQISDIAVFRSGSWYILQSTNNSFIAISFGRAGDIPTPADFTGDGRSEAAVFRPDGGFWYLLDLTNNNFNGVQFGTAGDVPTPADYDNDGQADISVFRPSNGSWYRLESRSGRFVSAQWGTNGDRPVPADYDADGRTDVAVFRPVNPASWFILRSSGGFDAVNFGMAEDIPVPADYYGDGRADITVFRPSVGAWYRLNSSSNSFVAIQWGAGGDIPIPSR